MRDYQTNCSQLVLLLVIYFVISLVTWEHCHVCQRDLLKIQHHWFTIMKRIMPNLLMQFPDQKWPVLELSWYIGTVCRLYTKIRAVLERNPKIQHVNCQQNFKWELFFHQITGNIHHMFMKPKPPASMLLRRIQRTVSLRSTVNKIKESYQIN